MKKVLPAGGWWEGQPPLAGLRLIIFSSVLMMLLTSIASSSVYISAINFDAPGNDHNNLNGEWVRISNSGAISESLAGWTLSDEGVKHQYTFPSFSLDPGASVTVFTGCGSNSA